MYMLLFVRCQKLKGLETAGFIEMTLCILKAHSIIYCVKSSSLKALSNKWNRQYNISTIISTYTITEVKIHFEVLLL